MKKRIFMVAMVMLLTLSQTAVGCPPPPVDPAVVPEPVVDTTGADGQFITHLSWPGAWLGAVAWGRLLGPDGRAIANTSFTLTLVPRDDALACPRDVAGFRFTVAGYADTTITEFRSFPLSIGFLIGSALDLGNVQLAKAVPPAEPPPVGPRLTILIRFEPGALEQLGVREEDVIAKIQDDLRAEIGDQIVIVAQRSDDRFLERFEEAVERLDRKYEVEAKRQRAAQLIQAIVDANRDRDEPVQIDPVLEAAIRDYETARQAFEEELFRKSSNLANLSPGTIGLSIMPAEVYGGRTLTGDSWPLGERWSILSTGFAKADFAQPGNPDRERALILQYLANAAKHEIGLQFGLKENQGGLDDAMRGRINRERGEHLIRDSRPVRYNTQDRTLLIERIKEWVGSQTTNEGASAPPLSEQSVTSIGPSKLSEAAGSPAANPAIGAVIGGIGTGLGIITGVTQVGGWAVSALGGRSQVNVNRGFEGVDFAVDLGLVYKLTFAVQFRFDDTAFDWGQRGFFELYVIKGNETIYYHRYPESGYFVDRFGPDNSQSRVIRSSIYLGAKHWSCRHVTDEIKLIGVVWDDELEVYPRAFSKWDGRRGFGGYPLVIDLIATNAHAPETISVTVVNPYYVEVIRNDGDRDPPTRKTLKDKDPFILKFKAVMYYRRHYQNIEILSPDPAQATVTIDGLQSISPWEFTVTEGDLRFELGPIIQVPARAYQRIKIEGSHSHSCLLPPCGKILTYRDHWGARVEGTNAVYVFCQTYGRVPRPFTWQAYFRRGRHSVQCMPPHRWGCLRCGLLEYVVQFHCKM
jgi:hypothetical protein